MTLPWRSNTTPEIAAEVDSRYETPGGAQNKVDVSQEYLLHLLKLAVTGLSNGSEAAIARYSTPYGVTYDWLKDRLDAADTKFLSLNSKFNNQYTVNVKDYGAKGDGVTNDTVSINQAISALNSKGGGTLYFPKGIYMISSTLILTRYTTVRGEVSHTTVIKCSNSFASTHNSAIVFRYDTNHCDAVSMYDITVEVNGQAVHGITGFSVYDSVIFQNVIVEGLDITHSAYRFIPHESLVSIDPVSQTIILLNCLGYVGANGATAPVFYFDSVQEMNIIGCKSFSARGFPTSIVSDSPGFVFDGCRGITMIGCSVGGSTSEIYPIRILSTNRPSRGFTITGTTFESVGKLLYVKGSVSEPITNINLKDSRNEGSGGSSPTIYLENVRDADIEILVGSAQQIGVTNSIVRNSSNMQIINDEFNLYFAGSDVMLVKYPYSAGTGMFLLVNDGTNLTQKRVEIGAADSAGSGYRMLRVSN